MPETRRCDAAALFAAWFARRSGFACASVIVGVFSLLVPIIMIDSLAAITLGAYGLREIARRPGLKGRRLAWTGILLGLTGLGMGVRCYTL